MVHNFDTSLRHSLFLTHSIQVLNSKQVLKTMFHNKVHKSQKTAKTLLLFNRNLTQAYLYLPSYFTTISFFITICLGRKFQQ